MDDIRFNSLVKKFNPKVKLNSEDAPVEPAYQEEMEPGHAVPDVYREYRARFSQKPTDLNAYRRQVMFRCSHIGTKELEILLRDYLLINQDKMTYEDLEEFDNEIVSVENPSLQRYLVEGQKILPEHDTKYMRILMLYVAARKSDYHGNVPKDIDA